MQIYYLLLLKFSQIVSSGHLIHIKALKGGEIEIVKGLVSPSTKNIA